MMMTTTMMMIRTTPADTAPAMVGRMVGGSAVGSVRTNRPGKMEYKHRK